MSELPGAPPPSPIPLKERASIVFVEKGQLDVLDGAFVLVDATGVRTVIPVGGLAAIMLKPGTQVSHATVALAAAAGTLLVWVGEAGVRLYAARQPGGARSDKLLWQCKLALDPDARLAIVRRMFEIRFGEDAPARRSVNQLRGIEGVRVREIYKGLAQQFGVEQFGVEWRRRDYDPSKFEHGDAPNRCVSAATSCLYGVTEAAVLAAGYAPAIGLLHSDKPLSFVYDIADLFRFDTVVPEAFRVAAAHAKGKLDKPLEMAVRHACRDAFRCSNILARIIPLIEEVLSAGGMEAPPPPPDAVGLAFADPPPTGDPGRAHTVVIFNNAPPRLRGRLAVWLLEVRARVYLGVYGAKTREMIIQQVKGLIGEGDAVVAWDAPNDAGFVFETFGANRRVPVDFDGLQLVAFHPWPDATNGSI